MNTFNTEPVSDEVSDKLVRVEILNRNAEFKRATNAEKRVLIAKDVIKQINLGRFHAAASRFYQIAAAKPNVYPVAEYLLHKSEKTMNNSVQTELLKNNITCNCCAVGAMFLSSVLFVNKEKFSMFSYTETDNLVNVLEGEKGATCQNGFDKIFTRKQLKLIEICYEQGCGLFNFSGYNLPFVKRINEFCHRHQDRTDRLLAIMKNIISNKGTFILP